MIEIFSIDFLKYAFLTGLLISIIGGFLSFFTVQKKLSFLTISVSHSAFGVLALAVLIGVNPDYLLYPFCFLLAVVVYEIKRRSILEFETILSIFFAFTMAVGIVLLKFNDYGSFDLAGLLFGSVVSATKTDFYVTLFFAIFLLVTFLFFNRGIIFTIFDEDVARVSGVNTLFINYLILFWITMLIVLSIKIIGIILLTAFLTLPASFSLMITRNYKSTIFVSILFSSIIFVLSFYVAYVFDFPPGATTVIVGSAVYFLLQFCKILKRD